MGDGRDGGAGGPTGLPRAVLWDLDGTLVDSAPLWRAAYDDLAAHLGGRTPPGMWARLAGRTIEESVARLADALGLAHDGAEVASSSRWLVARAATLVDEVGVPWRPGAADALALVRGLGLPGALVTTSWRAVVEPLLHHLDASFDVVVCGDEVARGKPAPDGYLLAAVRLGVAAADCVVVEDSPTGAAAAGAAGARVLVVPSGAPVAPAEVRTVRGSLVGLTAGELAAVGR